jgi:L-asparaginase/Glu-tRNA(Gln) amidotransferase subunit D
MKAQTKGELDWKKKEPGKLHKLGILKSTGASRKPRSISILYTGGTIEERGYSGTAVDIARAVDVFFLRRAQVLQ